MPTSPLITPIQQSTRSPSQSNQEKKKKKMKGFRIGKGEVWLTVFIDDIILYIENYIENPKEDTKGKKKHNTLDPIRKIQ